MTKLRQNQFYCVKCEKRVTCKPNDMCVTHYSNKRVAGGKVPALKGSCRCGTNLTKFVKRDSNTLRKLVNKYGYC